MEKISEIIPIHEKNEPSDHEERHTVFLEEDQKCNLNMLNYSHLVNAEYDDCETEETPNYNEYSESWFEAAECDLENNSKNCMKHEESDSYVNDGVNVKKEMDIGDTVLQESDLSMILKIKPESEVVFEQDMTRPPLAEVMNSKNNIVIKIVKSQNGYEIAPIKPLSETKQSTVSETQNKENNFFLDGFAHEYLTCYHCGRKHKGKQSLEKHLKRKHKIVILNRITNQTGKIETNTKFNQVYMCAYCGKTYAAKISLIYHIQTKHEKTDETKSENTCQHCHKSFSCHGNLKKHLKIFHSEIFETFECRICGSVFRQKGNLKVHYNSHLNQSHDEVNCNTCGRMFNNNRLLQRHNDRIHTKRRNKQCQICRRKYITQQRFDEHIRKCSKSPKNNANTEAKELIYGHINSTFRCHLCSKHYYSKSTLRHHLMLHRSLTICKKFECNDCEYKSLNRAHFIRHLRGSGCIKFKTRKKNIKCKYCPKMFDSKRNMKMHLHRICGTNSTGAECELCGKFMKRTAYMSEHRKKKHSKLVFKCDRCNETFGRRKDYLTKHIEKCFDL